MVRIKFELNWLEQYSRKSSVRVYGTAEEEGEKVGEKAIMKIKEETGVEINPEEIDIVHRVPGKKTKDRSRGILIKFVSHQSKVNVMKKRKNTATIRKSEDLAYGTRNMLNKIHNNKDGINVEKPWSIDGRIKYKLRNADRIYEIRSADDFNNSMNKVDMEQ